MSEFKEWWKDECCGITFDYPNESALYAWEHQQAKIDELQKRVDELKGNVNNALSFYNYAKSDVNIGMIKMKQLLRGEE